MRIEIRGRGITVDSELRCYVERRLRFALRRTVPGPALVTVRLQDLNGPRGGKDKLARILLSLSSGVTHLAEDVACDVRTAVDGAASCLSRTAGRQHRRERATIDSLQRSEAPSIDQNL